MQFSDCQLKVYHVFPPVSIALCGIYGNPSADCVLDAGNLTVTGGNAGGVRIDAVYTPIPYTATFVADGKTVGTTQYTVGSTSIDEPEVPAKIGYTGAWASYTFDVGGITVNAVYTLIGHPSIRIVDFRPSRTVW